MRDLFGHLSRVNLLSVVKRLAATAASAETRRQFDVIDLEHEPHWLHRDIGMLDGRPTRQEMRRPQKWPHSL